MGTARRAALGLILGMGTISCGFLPGGQQAPGAPNQPADRLLPDGQGAPQACGFAPGTALEFAGRATTAGLGVQEVPGDPMSNDPADIYVTRDAFDQGELHGRLVCAIYVNPPGFVEITVHPDDMPEVVEEPAAPAEPPPDGISADEAVAVARDALAEGPDHEPAAWEDDWEIAPPQAGPVEQALPGREVWNWARDLPPDMWVWSVSFYRGDQGAQVIIDFVDGTVYGIAEYILN